MNFDEFLEALSATDDIEEKKNIYNAFTSECDSVREAFVDFIYSKVKDTEDYKNYVNDMVNGAVNGYKDGVDISIFDGKNNAEALENYIHNIYRNLRIRGRHKARVEAKFEEFKNQIGITEFLQSDAIGDKYVYINGDNLGHYIIVR